MFSDGRATSLKKFTFVSLDIEFNHVESATEPWPDAVQGVNRNNHAPRLLNVYCSVRDNCIANPRAGQEIIREQNLRFAELIGKTNAQDGRVVFAAIKGQIIG